jgi:DNA-binding response OmpR family regulator
MPNQRRRVLCAEPHVDTCSLLTELLGQQGHEVVAATSIEECLDLVRERDFDLYMLDDDYIDGTALELCRRLRTATPQTPILFFSAQAFVRDRQRALEAGAHSYFIKPGDILEIVQAVNSILAPGAPRRRPHESERP